MSVSYEEAMGTLQAMFDQFDRETLALVLQANRGHMENTVDQLLSMEAPAPGVASDPAPGPAPAPAPPVHDEAADLALARELSQQEEQMAAAAQPGVDEPAGFSVAEDDQLEPRGTRIELPPDFLKVPGGRKSAQMVQDEMMAAMMQDEMFLAELRQHPEFGAYMRNEQDYFSGGAAAAVAPGFPGAPGAGARGEQPRQQQPQQGEREPEVSLGDKLSEMGDAARAKMNEMFIRFRSRNARREAAGEGGYDAVPLMGGGGDDEDEDDDDDEEVIVFDSDLSRRNRGEPVGTEMVDFGARRDDEEAGLTDNRRKKDR